MKIGKYDITFGNVKSFIQGKSRYLINKFGPDFLHQPTHIREQIVMRYAKVKPECKGKGGCIHCGCNMSEKVFSNDPCEHGCYGPFMDKGMWDLMKTGKK